MIAFLKGKIILKTDKFIILAVNNIGFKVFLSRRRIDQIGINKENVEFFIFEDIKENARDLYGFLTYKELECFELVNSIRGIGPKAALEISSYGSLQEIKERLQKGDKNLFKDIPGIGEKKARTLLLELVDKIKISSPQKRKEDELELALNKLGFSKHQIQEAITHLPSELEDLQEKIRWALKYLSK